MSTSSLEHNYLQTWHVQPLQGYISHSSNCQHEHNQNNEHIYESPRFTRRNQEDAPSVSEHWNALENGAPPIAYYYEVDPTVNCDNVNDVINNNSVIENGNDPNI